jgi:hypothetical protein
LREGGNESNRSRERENYEIDLRTKERMIKSEKGNK